MKRTRYDVNIVTPVYGSPSFLDSMLNSLLSVDAGDIKWSITLVDDAYAGPDREKVDLVYTKYSRDNRIKVLRSRENSGFAASNNKGFSNGSAPLLLLLNSDILIKEPGWLERMAQEFDDSDVGISGARLLFFEEDHPNFTKDPGRPAGKTQHAGVAFNVMGQPYHIFMGWDSDHINVMQRREMNAVTGACLMIRRTDYFRVGGLDTDYKIGNFEDVQICLQIRALDKKVLYNPSVCLYHFAGGSNNTATAKFNETLFKLKCANLIEHDDYRYGRYD